MKQIYNKIMTPLLLIFLLYSKSFANEEINIDWGKWNASPDENNLDYNYEKYLFELDKSNLHDYKSQFHRPDVDDFNLEEMEIEELKGL